MEKMDNSKNNISNSTSPKLNKKELRKKSRMKFSITVSILSIILFIVTMCITVVVNFKAENKIANEAYNEDNFINVTYDDESTQESETEKETATQAVVMENTNQESANTIDETKNYNDDDLYYLASAVCREAGGESEEIQLLVANVIINRVNSSLYPNTIYEVLTQYKQYGMMWKHGVSFPEWADQEVKDQCYSVAKRILEGERFCPENVLFQAEFEQGCGIFKQFDDDYYFCYYA